MSVAGMHMPVQPTTGIFRQLTEAQCSVTLFGSVHCYCRGRRLPIAQGNDLHSMRDRQGLAARNLGLVVVCPPVTVEKCSWSGICTASVAAAAAAATAVDLHLLLCILPSYHQRQQQQRQQQHSAAAAAAAAVTVS